MPEEPRRLKRGENALTATFVAARAAMGDGSPRADGGRVVGDPLDAVLGSASEGLRTSQAGRRNTPHTLFGEIEHNVLQRRRGESQPAPAAAATTDDQDAVLKAWADRIDAMEPAERAALEAALDAAVAVELGSVAEFEMEDEFIDWDAA